MASLSTDKKTGTRRILFLDGRTPDDPAGQDAQEGRRA
jgi:hypothetical protein